MNYIKTSFLGILMIVMGFETMAQKNAKPNIIFIFADDIGWEDLSISGNTTFKTPN